MALIENQRMDEERALFGRKSLFVRNCVFDGPRDGESAIKECEDVTVEDSVFSLRYPLWHVQGLVLRHVRLTESCRAACWYSGKVRVADSKLHGAKVFRECKDVFVRESDIQSQEYGWRVDGFEVEDCQMDSEYAFLGSSGISLRNVSMTGKYYLQYVRNVRMDHCSLDTKDALWEAEDVYIRDSVLKGEYLAWHSRNMTLENCLVIGAQPLCYAKGLRLIDTEVREGDFCFEKSEVEARLTAHVKSIRNPLSGTIQVPSLEELIQDDPECKGRVVVTG